MIGEDARQLSTSEKHRVALARMLVGNDISDKIDCTL